MKVNEVTAVLDEIIEQIPTGMQITVALRYEGAEPLKEKLAEARRGLEELRTKLATAKKGEIHA